MIQNLLFRIIELLQTELGEQIAEPTTHIVAVPIAEPKAEILPLIGIYPGKLDISQNLRENSDRQPITQDHSQEITVDTTNLSTSYSLEKTPIKKSVQCQLIIDRQEKTLQEDTDFTIDREQNKITFKHDLSNVSKILLQYSFKGILDVRELQFQQEFFVDICADEIDNIEKFSSLVTVIILINHDELIQHYNLTKVTQYQTDTIVNTHTISQINVLNGVYYTLPNKFKLQLKFQVRGQIKMLKALTDGGGTITEIQISSGDNRRIEKLDIPQTPP